MIPRRLYLQIYATIVAALVLTVALASLAFTLLNDGTRPSQTAISLAQRAVAMALPPADAPEAEQIAVLERIGAGLDIDLALYSADGRLIGIVGASPPTEAGEGGGAHHGMRLADGRVIEAHVLFPSGAGLFALPLILGSVALAIAVASFPLVRRLSGRLERLQASVERIGDGDLGARAEVEGRDEIAGLAESFNTAAGRIEALVEAHRTLLANASHELRTPLSRIRMGIEMFRRTGEEKRLANVEVDIGQLDGLVDEILTLSRLDAGAIAVEPDIDFLGLVAEECARMEVELHGQPAVVAGDRELLRRLVGNLLANALHHGAPPVDVDVATDAAHVMLTVRDGGDGIDPPERERVFERFYRGAGARNPEGYGLGLPLVRQIAKAHGGRAWIADDIKSAVRVILPRSVPQT